MESNRERLSQEIDKCLAGELDQRESVMICEHTPLILQKLGLCDYPILFSQGHIHDCLHEKGNRNFWHGLHKEDLLNIPNLIINPVCVFDSWTRGRSVVLTLNAVDDDNLPLVASIKSDGNGQYKFEKISNNYMTSVYGKNDYDQWLSKAIDKSCILYVDKEKTQELGNLSQLQLLRGLPLLGYDGIIHKSENIVNDKTKPILDNTKIQEFNEKWKKRNIFLKEDNKGIHLIAVCSNEFHKNCFYEILSIKPNGKLDIGNENINEIKWIMQNEKEFYKNNPDVADNRNKQHHKFNKICGELDHDFEFMFVPRKARKDQKKELYTALSFIIQKMRAEYLAIAGYEQSKESPWYIIKNKTKHKSSIDRAKTASQISTTKNKNINKEER